MYIHRTLFLCCLALLCLATPQLAAQRDDRPRKKNKPPRTFAAGQVDLHLTLGVLPTYFADRKRSTQGLPALYASTDYRLSQRFSLGAFYGRSNAETDEYVFSDGVRGSWQNRTQVYGLRALLHFDAVPKSQLYGGFSVGQSRTLVNCDNPTMLRMERYMGIGRDTDKLIYSALFGGRYQLNSRLAAVGELEAGGISLVRLGLSVRLF